MFLCIMFNNLHAPLFNIHCAWLLYIQNVNNIKIDGPDSRQVPSPPETEFSLRYAGPFLEY